jgi:hypothetical protein
VSALGNALHLAAVGCDTYLAPGSPSSEQIFADCCLLLLNLTLEGHIVLRKPSRSKCSPSSCGFRFRACMRPSVPNLEMRRPQGLNSKMDAMMHRFSYQSCNRAADYDRGILILKGNCSRVHWVRTGRLHAGSAPKWRTLDRPDKCLGPCQVCLMSTFESPHQMLGCFAAAL